MCAVDEVSKGCVEHLVEFNCLLQACDLEPTYSAEATAGSRDGYVTYSRINLAFEGASVRIFQETHEENMGRGWNRALP